MYTSASDFCVVKQLVLQVRWGHLLSVSKSLPGGGKLGVNAAAATSSRVLKEDPGYSIAAGRGLLPLLVEAIRRTKSRVNLQCLHRDGV